MQKRRERKRESEWVGRQGEHSLKKNCIMVRAECTGKSLLKYLFVLRFAVHGEQRTRDNTHFVYFVLRSIFWSAPNVNYGPSFYVQTEPANKIRSRRASNNSMSAFKDTRCADFTLGEILLEIY